MKLYKGEFAFLHIAISLLIYLSILLPLCLQLNYINVIPLVILVHVTFIILVIIKNRKI